MIFVIFVIIAVIFCWLSRYFDKRGKDILSLLTFIPGGLSACIAVIMVIIIAMSLINCPRTEARWEERYASLNTRIDEHIYSFYDRGQLVQDVQEWNEDLAAAKVSRNNIWICVFYPESLEKVEKIDLGRIE